MSRRLPIYFLIDVSESMVGEPIEQVEEGISTIIKELKTDPYALETVSISIICFAGKSKTLTPLEDIITFYPPKIPIGSGTSLSAGLHELMNALDKEVTKTTHDRKGDWRPLVFLFTDGIPTDDSSKAIEKWNSKYKNQISLIAISIGENTNYNLLGQLTDQVLKFNNTSNNSYKDFFKWVTASIKATSENINNNNTLNTDIVKPVNELIEKIDITKKYNIPDDNFVILQGKCSQTDKQYLIKYEADLVNSGIEDFKTKIFKARGAYKVEEKTYKEISSEIDYSLKISSDELYGNPSCPCCGNQVSVAHCICGGIHCITGNGEAKCPWCGNNGIYGFTDESLNINRTLG